MMQDCNGDPYWSARRIVWYNSTTTKGEGSTVTITFDDYAPDISYFSGVAFSNSTNTLVAYSPILASTTSAFANASYVNSSGTLYTWCVNFTISSSTLTITYSKMAHYSTSSVGSSVNVLAINGVFGFKI